MKSLLLTFLLISVIGKAQKTLVFPEGKKAIIVLTYDDALASQLDIAIPQLDKVNIKGTFFLQEPSAELQINRWSAASQNGHELANHTVYHPCHSSKFLAEPRYYSENYTVSAILREIGTMNKILYAIDNKPAHTFAYPCYETTVGGKSYIDSLRKCGFIKYARWGGNSPIITNFKNLDPFQVPSISYDKNTTGAQLIEFVKNVEKSKGMGVLTFHGVGGDYLQVSSEAHLQLLEYLNKKNKEIWVTTFEQAMDYVTKNWK